MGDTLSVSIPMGKVYHFAIYHENKDNNPEQIIANIWFCNVWTNARGN